MIELVDPRGPRDDGRLTLAPRPTRDRLTRIGLLCNEASVAHGTLHLQRYFGFLERELPKRLGPLEFHRETKPILTRPAEIGQLERFRGWQAVINGLGK